MTDSEGRREEPVSAAQTKSTMLRTIFRTPNPSTPVLEHNSVIIFIANDDRPKVSGEPQVKLIQTGVASVNYLATTPW